MRAGRQMGRMDHAGQPDQRVARRRRLLRVDIQRGASDFARPNRRRQRLCIDQHPARRVDDPHAVLHPRDAPGVDHVPRAVIGRSVQGDDVAAGQQVVQRDDPDAIAFLASNQPGIVSHNRHVERQRAPGDRLPDAAQADDAQGLVPQFRAHEAALPAPFQQRLVAGGDVAGQGQQQAEGILRRRDRVAAGCVHDRDAPGRRRRQINVVNTGPGAGNGLQMGRGRQKLGVHPRGATDDQGIGVSRRRQRLAAGERSGSQAETIGRLQDLKPLAAELVRNEYMK